jgi:hypothetical protein
MCIKVGDYGAAKNASDKLLDNLMKYYNSRGIDANHFYDLFEDLTYALLYNTNNHFKRELVHNSLREIIKKIKSSTVNPLERLKEIYGDIRHLIGEIDKKNANEIIDCFDELSELKLEMEAMGGTVYNYYTIMMQKVGDCASTIRRASDRKPNDTILTQIENKFSSLFQSIEKVLAPPVRIEISRKEIFDKVKEGMPMGEVAEATGQSEEDLRMLFQQEQASRMAEEMSHGREDTDNL